LVVPEFRSDIGGDFRAGNIAVLDEIGAKQRLRQHLRCGRVAVMQPVVGTARCDRRHRKLARHPEGQAEPARRTHQVMEGVTALHRDGRKRSLAGDLEYCAQQDRTPDRVAPVPGGEGIDLGRSEVAVGRGKIEIEIDGLGHGASLDIEVRSKYQVPVAVHLQPWRTPKLLFLFNIYIYVNVNQVARVLPASDSASRRWHCVAKKLISLSITSTSSRCCSSWVRRRSSLIANSSSWRRSSLARS